MFYNFCKVQNTQRVTPEIQAGRRKKRNQREGFVTNQE